MADQIYIMITCLNSTRRRNRMAERKMVPAAQRTYAPNRHVIEKQSRDGERQSRDRQKID